jgi:hypothetical protein
MVRSGFAWVLILGFATAARAQIFDISVTASVDIYAEQDVGVDQSFSQTVYAHQLPEAAVPQTVQGNVAKGLNSASGRVWATFGRLSASGSASSSPDPEVQHSGNAAGGGGADVQDTLKVQSSTLANGAPVSLSLSYALSGFYNPLSDNTGEYTAGIHATLDAFTSQSGNSLNVSFDSDANQNVGSLSGTLDAQVGETVHLDYGLSSQLLISSAAVPRGVTSAIGGSLSIQSETPGVTLIADSGYDYGQVVVPEPSAAASLVAALVGLIGLGRQRARARMSVSTRV